MGKKPLYYYTNFYQVVSQLIRTDPSQITLSRQTRLLERKSGSVDEEEEISPPDDLDEDNDNDDSKHVQLKTPAAQIPTQPAAPIKKHECKKCKKSFSRVSLLNRHMKLHLGIKPYQCTVCGWRFLQSYNLKKHLLTHGPKSLRCSQCKASFIDRGQLKTHVLRKHNNKVSCKKHQFHENQYSFFQRDQLPWQNCLFCCLKYKVIRSQPKLCNILTPKENRYFHVISVRKYLQVRTVLTNICQHTGKSLTKSIDWWSCYLNNLLI